jgi:hypothetical protein
MSLEFAMPVDKLTFSHLSLGGFGTLYYIITNNIVIYFLRNISPTMLKSAAYEKVLKLKSKPLSRSPRPSEPSKFLAST